MRGTALLEFLHSVLPEWIALPAAVVTQAGDTWAIVLAGIVASVVVCRTDPDEPSEPDSSLRRRLRSATARGRDSPREPDRAWHQGPWPLAVVVGGLALMSALKYLFALSRPETLLLPVESAPSALRPLYENAGTSAGYAFPSGHAVGATVAYGLLASVLEVGTRRQRIAAAGTLVAAVSASRVVLGVHYPADVVAGVLLGLAYLAGSWWLLERCGDRTTTALALASGLALLAVVASAGTGLAVSLFALCLGALVFWHVQGVTDWSAPTPSEIEVESPLETGTETETDSTRLHAGHLLSLALLAVVVVGSVLVELAPVVAPASLFVVGAATVLLTTRP